MQEKKVKEQVLQAFYHLSFSHGLKKVTVDMLAKECGISKKTLYCIFNSKDEIVTAFTDQILDSIEEQFMKIQIKEDDPCRILNEFFSMVISIAGNIPSGVFRDIKRFYPELEDKIAVVRSHFSGQFLAIIRRGVEEGAFQPINMRFIEGFYTGMVNYVFNPDFILDNDLTIEETLVSFQNILLSALMSPPVAEAVV